MPALKYPDVPVNLSERNENPPTEPLSFEQGDTNWQDIQDALNFIRPIVKAIRDAGGISRFSISRPGDIKMVGESGIESGWLACDGSFYSTATYPDLFAAIGYNFGGSGGNFFVPDLRGRVPMGYGLGPGLTNRILGAKVGVETALLPHSHTVTLSADGTISIPQLTVNVTLTASTDPTSRSLTIDPIVPSGTIDTSGLSTVSGVTGDTALSIQGDSSDIVGTFIGDPVAYIPTGSITLPTFNPGGLGTLNTNVSGTVTGTTDDQSLSLSGTISVTGQACTSVQPLVDGGVSVITCIAPLIVDISAGGITPNPHNHTITSLPLTITQGLSGALDPPSFTGSPSFTGDGATITATGAVTIPANSIASALSITANPHNHTIPSLSVSGTATFTGDSVTPSGTVDVGAITVSGTGSGMTDSAIISVSIPVTGATDISSPMYGTIQPSTIVNFIIKT